jgi:hypothetical protein
MPSALRPVAALTQLLSPKARRWLSRKMGNDTVFIDLDHSARAGYEQRAQTATGVLEDNCRSTHGHAGAHDGGQLHAR